MTLTGRLVDVGMDAPSERLELSGDAYVLSIGTVGTSNLIETNPSFVAENRWPKADIGGGGPLYRKQRTNENEILKNNKT